MDFDPSEVLAKPLMAYLATGSPDGPRSSPVWFLWGDDAIWLIGSRVDSFPARLEAEQCVRSASWSPTWGILRHVGIRGQAEIRGWDKARLHRLLARYLGAEPTEWNAWFKVNIVQPLDRMIRVTPVSVVARDMSYFKSGPTLASTRKPNE